VLGFGAGAKVLQPAKLVEIVRDEAQKIEELYQKKIQKAV
jgi:hypothetical protein